MKISKNLFIAIILFFFLSCGNSPQPQQDSPLSFTPLVSPEQVSAPIEEATSDELNEAPVLPEPVEQPALPFEEYSNPPLAEQGFFFEEPHPEEQITPFEVTSSFDEESALPAEEPEFLVLMEPVGEDQLFDLPEPSLDIPEVVSPLIGQADDVEVQLPEPVAGVVADPYIEPGLVPEPAVAQSAPVQPAPPDPQPEPVIPAVPPSPPSFLRQPEPEIVPPARETPSLPLSPLPELPARTPPVAQEEEIVYSRIVRATVGQIVEIPFRGTGWVYLGELSSRQGITFESRRLDAEGQSFILRAEAPGTYVLKFYRQDFIRDYILNDHVQVIVGEAPDSSGIGYFNPPVDRGRVIAEPRWPLIDGQQSANAPVQTNPPASSQTQSSPPAASAATPVADNVPQAPDSSQEIQPSIQAEQQTPEAGSAAQEIQPVLSALLPDEYLGQAKQEYDAGRVESALSILDRFRQDYPSGTDEAWWLYGQLLEANSPSRDIRLALEYYRRLVQEFPQSPRAPEAQNRIAYLERYYFNIR